MVQRVAVEIERKHQPLCEERNDKFVSPSSEPDYSKTEDTGIKRNSHQTKRKEPIDFREPVKHSKEVSDENISDVSLLKAALTAYRENLKTRCERLVEISSLPTKI